ncbi:enoyl-CoA hydratase/isomerase family protein [Humitalea sp. 24SJ18S-53]|uniref:enoyl-CoA hydratase/isomerase family protein n=1 Tax=Humitalea sp. 24SJ18S-53 TaxID=3422307 RepID=UPI003D66F307
MSVVVTHAEGVRRIALDRPQKRNALDTATIAALCDALVAAGADASVRAIVITGNGPHFCAGADLAEMRANPGDRERFAMTGWMMDAPRTIGKPIIAAVHGSALGAGAALALACDAVVMTDDACLGWPEARHKMMPRVVAPGLIARVPPGVAFDLLATGRPMPAPEALRFGLAARVVPPEALLTEATALATAATLLPPEALLELKKMIAG